MAKNENQQNNINQSDEKKSTWTFKAVQAVPAVKMVDTVQEIVDVAQPTEPEAKKVENENKELEQKVDKLIETKSEKQDTEKPEPEKTEPEKQQDKKDSVLSEVEDIKDLLKKIEPLEKISPIETVKAVETTKPPVRNEQKEEQRKLSKLYFALGVVVAGIAVSFGLVVLMLNALPPVIESVVVSETLNDDNTLGIAVTVSDIPLRYNESYMCAIVESETAPLENDPAWISFNEGVATANVDFSNINVYVMDSRGTVSDSTQQLSVDKVYDVSIPSEKIFLALDDTRMIDADVTFFGDVDTAVSWSSSNSSVASVENGVITTHSVGDVTITASIGDVVSNELEITSTYLINIPDVDRVRPYLEGEVYTLEEATLMDEILASRIAEAGYGTRAGALEAARFMMLEFPYRLHYFFENGRLSPNPGRPIADGEGRYYHIGMFLSEDKYADLDPIRFGPAYWGQPLLNFQDEQIWTPGVQYPNGMTCSGFVSWALLNGGFDVGDMGAGNEYWDNDLCDLGPHAPPTLETIESGVAKPGDLIGWDGHIAMLAGWDEQNIYVAETYSQIRGTRMTVIPRDRFDFQLYEYIILMDDVYKQDGEYTVELY